MNAKLVLLLVASVATFHFSHCEEEERVLNRVRRAPKKRGQVQQIVMQCSYPAHLACSDGSNCILQSQRCDGQYNCRDGSDEANCAQAQQVYAVKQQAPQVVMAPAPGAQPAKAEQQLQPQTVMMVAPKPGNGEESSAAVEQHIEPYFPNHDKPAMVMIPAESALTGFGQEIGMAIQGYNDASFANVNAEQCAQFCLESTAFFCRSFDHSMDGQCHLSSRNKNMVKGEFQPFAGWSYFERGLSGVSEGQGDIPPPEGGPEGGFEPAPVMVAAQHQQPQYVMMGAGQQQQKGKSQGQRGGQTAYLPRPAASQQQQQGKSQGQRGGQTVYLPRPAAGRQQQQQQGKSQGQRGGQTVYLPRPAASHMGKAQSVVMPAPQNVVVLPQVVNLICPQGFIRHDRICYAFSTAPVNYTTAEGECGALGATLASINNENQHMFLTEYLNVVNPGENHWIGLEDRATENQFMYADSTPLGKFMKWAQGEPNDQGKDEDCVEMFPNGGGYFRWNDESCCRDRHYICQAPPERRITCFCHNHSTVCADDGVCADCQHNTEGDQCEKCSEGYEGFATQGTADSCRPAQQLVAVQVVQQKKPVMTVRMPK
ncbi:CLEC10A [Branchiostoma lanceolatum]|uniref:CLEC10A protein n=1 Tax=Branchiostoma lanceolatum TaxID=7740 RepID=A0A8J9ZCQ3_BRALA|nr:CLEC10A [Branchiostoma lanceolatum]